MKTAAHLKRIRLIATILVSTLILTACLSEEESDGSFYPPPVSSGPANSPPRISGSPPARIDVGELYSFSPTAWDDDGDSLIFAISSMPRWASFDSSTGRLSGTPTLADAGTHSNIVISVSDGTDSASLAAFSVTVNMTPTNSAPTISGTPSATVNEGQNYSFMPMANDADGDTLTFSVSGQPSWASFDAATGRLSGTPGAGSAGVYSGISISVSDGEASASLSAFSITVNAVVSNSPPTISGTPADNVNQGDAYSFIPTADDADGDSLTFSISGQPAWANFDEATGALTGTPGAGDVGVFSNIEISVSDGNASASLPAFSITVNAIAMGSASLSWTAPTQNEDGSMLTDLAGFKIYWGTTPGSYSDSVTIDNPSVTTYIVENLAPGTYEFTATAYNEAGVESRFSGTATKTIQ